MQLIIDDQPWPGMHLTDPVSDWQGYSYLACDCSASPGPPMDVFAGVLLNTLFERKERHAAKAVARSAETPQIR